MSSSEATADDKHGLFDQQYAPTITHAERVFEGRVWNIDHESFEYNGETLERDYVNHTGAVAVLAIDENDRVLVIRQYRHPVRLRDWEIPAGLLDIAGESPLLGAQRELAEEADLEADSWNVLGDYNTSPGGSNECIRLYLARDLHNVSQPHDRGEEEADIEVRWVSLDEAVDAVLANTVSNSVFQVAVLRASAAKAKGWASLQPGDAPWPQLDWRNKNQPETNNPSHT